MFMSEAGGTLTPSTDQAERIRWRSNRHVVTGWRKTVENEFRPLRGATLGGSVRMRKVDAHWNIHT